MKKLIALASAGAMLLSVSGVAFAITGFYPQSGTTNTAVVNQSVSSYAGSGGISQFGGSNWAVTGGGVKSEATGVVVANTQVGCNTCNVWGSTTNTAVVTQGVTSQAASGPVSQVAFGFGGHNYGMTGGLVNSEALGVTVVNTAWSGK